MANQRHVDILAQGVAAWNTWRAEHAAILPDLSGATLNKLDLRSADLSGCDCRGTVLDRCSLIRCTLRGAHLEEACLRRASLREARLPDAHLNGADLHHAELRSADLSGADLTRASLRKSSLQNARLLRTQLRRTDFLGATLSGCDLTGATLCEANFADTSLRGVLGLDSCLHAGPSTLDHRTLRRSGRLPAPFLEGCGIPWEVAKHLVEAEASCTCFISYASANEPFARKIRADLTTHGIECFLACDDMLAGDKILERVHQEIGRRDCVLLVLSADSVASEWVEREVKRALYEEEQRRRVVLVPVRLDNCVMETSEAWAVHLRIDRHIPDFGTWHDVSAYRQQLARLLRALSQERAS